MRLTVLICTHNRAELLGRVLASLNAATRPGNWQVRILVGANDCSDDTVASLQRYQQDAGVHGWLPLEWFEEPIPCKSHALNHAIRLLSDGAVALVDDDHRVDRDYLVHICQTLQTYPEATLFCGRILPDWDGSEPVWVHDTGPYRIYPLPIPCFDLGMAPRLVTVEHGPLPGGGNLFLRTGVFGRIGGFSTDLGPRRHNLCGGEDSEFVLTALQQGERLQYVPEVLQYHYVDTQRFKLGYLIRKGYQRSRSAARVNHQDRQVPRYIWRKLAEHAAHSVFSLSWPRTRFYLMRTAATLGELQGMREKARCLRAQQPTQGALMDPSHVPHTTRTLTFPQGRIRMPLKSAIKQTLRSLGYKIEKIDPLEESIPADYNHSPFLPRIYRGALDRYLYFKDMVDKVQKVEGDIVECGVSIGHGALLFTLFSDYIGTPRTYYGFDSFEGFPEPVAKDETTPIKGKGFWANPPDTVLKVLQDGRLGEEIIRERIRLIKGWFDQTLPEYQGRIALLHLDCDLYESYKLSLETLYDKVQPGGVIMFDEYGDTRWPGATKAIDEFFHDRPEAVQQHPKCTWKYHVVKQ